jgi:hypothetical protein
MASENRSLARQMPLLIMIAKRTSPLGTSIAKSSAGAAAAARRCSSQEKSYVDEVICRLQNTLAQTPIVRFRALSMRMDLVGIGVQRLIAVPTEIQKQKGIVMAKMIEFYTPKNFVPGSIEELPPGRGKVIEFCSRTKTMGLTRPGVSVLGWLLEEERTKCAVVRE